MVEPEDGKIAAIGSGGNLALSAARALHRHANLPPKELVRSLYNSRQLVLSKYYLNLFTGG